MAVIHKATLTPSKNEVAQSWLDKQPWGGYGPIERAGGYRFDDPDGEVGVEGMLIARGDQVLHVPMTYRSAPLDGAEAHLIATAEHSALGKRWIYEAHADPVAVACYRRALDGEQQDERILEFWDGDTLLERRENPTTLHVEGDAEPSDLTFAQVIGELSGERVLIAEWPGGSGVVAAG